MTFDGEKVTDPKIQISRDVFDTEGKVLKRGKKKFCKVIVED